ncbi:3-deoxy-manno-octulosonate cytidylyltransferase, partial [Akkermansiaceae bacterium]|nr:3-deoxy-manno-octulosonate cytidylyltransferase [Akkermansiaceae bacterium]
MSREKEKSHIIGIIPARWASSRFPGKPLHPLLGKPLLQHVFERATLCSELDELVIATDDGRIAALCKTIGAKVIHTRSDHPTGTDRIAEAAEQCEAATHVINIQGDEPLLEPELVDALARELRNNCDLPMITAGSPLDNLELIADSNVVKLVIDQNQNALYFSRSPIPFRRNDTPSLPTYRHLGIYGYRVDFLKHFINLPPSPLEIAEGLEQLRALENSAT